MKDIKRNKVNRINSENSLDSFSLMEDAIDLSIQQEYFNLSETIDFDHIDYKEVFKESSKLFSENIPVEMKKKTLILLAHFGTAESYKILEKYLKSSERALRDWALLLLRQLKI